MLSHVFNPMLKHGVIKYKTAGAFVSSRNREAHSAVIIKILLFEAMEYWPTQFHFLIEVELFVCGIEKGLFLSEKI